MEQMTLPVILAILLGIFLKGRPDISNKLIPFILFASQFVGRLVLELGIGVAEAGGFFSGLAKAAGPQIEGMLWQSAMATVLAVGAHSVGKNSRQALPMFLRFLRGFAAEKAVGVALTAAEKAAVRAEKDLADLPKPPTQP